MTHLAKEIPYRNSHVPYSSTKNDIEEMLKEAGAIALRWTETPDSMKGNALPILEFILPSELKGVAKQFGVRIQAPLLSDRKRGSNGYITTPNKNASMRLLFWYLKARLEAVRFGLEDIFDAFMSRVINSLPDGRKVTLSETIREHPHVISEILPSFEIVEKPKPLPKELEKLND
jgi:hypothetical protein